MPEVLTPSAGAAVPYVGLRSFAEEEAALFFGRERETVELSRLVENDTVSILYGVSGVGKSSLLNAGLFPRLRERGFLPVRLRLDHDESAPPPVLQLQRAVHAAAQSAGVFLPEPREGETLWEYFHHRERAEFWTDDHRLLTPTLALDQFEEFFSLGHDNISRSERSAGFRAQLLDLLENARSPEASLTPERFQLSSAATPRCLLILREDFIAQLLPIVDALAERLPGIHRQKLRLVPFGHEAAREVIAGPARALGLEPPDDETTRAIVRLATPPGGQRDDALTSVEPARLALLLSALEGERRARSLPRIDPALAAHAEGDLFTRFVEGAVAGQPDATRRFLEEELVTPAGYRSDATTDQAVRFGVEETTLQRLCDYHLLTTRPGWPVRYELSHDLLCPPLRKRREERHAREAAAAARLKNYRLLRKILIIVTGALLTLVVVALVFALFALARARQEAGLARVAESRAEQQRQLALASERDAQTAKMRVASSRKAADELINFMQYDLSDTLGTIGRLDLLADINARIRRYHDEHPAEPGDQAAEDAAQRERTAALSQQGDILLAQGKLAEALKSYQESLAIGEKLADKDFATANWQHGQAIGYMKVGDVLSARGDLAEALKNYRGSLAIIQKLAAKDPANPKWQRDLAVDCNKIGDALTAQGDLAGAIQNFTLGLTIVQKLANQNPTETGYQHDIATSLVHLGSAQEYLYDLPASLKSYRDAFEVLSKLTAQNPANALWQHDLAGIHISIGELQEGQGNLPAALKSYQASLIIRRRLAAQDPSNADWQRDLSGNLFKLGDVEESLGDLSAAIGNYKDGLVIARKLAVLDPSNTDWQRDLAVGLSDVGDVQRASGEFPAAFNSYQESLAIRARLAERDPTNLSWQLELAYNQRNIGIVLIKQNKKEEARMRFEQDRQLVDRLVAEHPGNYPVAAERAYVRWQLVDSVDMKTPAGKDQARELLKEAADILHELQKSPGLQSEQANWLREIEHDFGGLKK